MVDNLEDKIHRILTDFRQVIYVKNTLALKFYNQVDIKILNNYKVSVEIYPRLTKYFKCNVYIPCIYNNVYIEVINKKG